MLEDAPKRRTVWLIHALLIALVLAVYVQAAWFGFTNYDDGLYVYDNPRIVGPFSLDTLRWAFTSVDTNNWYPLTLLSHKLDYSLFGLRAGAHHLVNVALHILNTLLVFEIFRRAMRGKEGSWLGASAAMAALFAIHPLHVESVAWVAERKDVLSTFFGLLAILAYVGYARRPGVGRLSLVAVFFACSLMAKSMLVFLPCLLLLLDYWPLERLASEDNRRVWPWRVAEKIPLFALTFGAAWMAMRLKTPQQYSLLERIGFTLVAYASYVKQTLWPFGLAAYYPYPKDPLPLWQPLAAAAVLALVSAFAVAQWRKRPYVLVGWLWFAGVLFPASGIVQKGNVIMADRYTYVPLIGLFIIAVYGVRDVAMKRGIPRYAVAVVCGVLLAALSVASFVQVGYWHDTKTLMRHTIRVTRDNNFAHYNLGTAYLDEGKYEDADTEFRAAMEADPSNVETLSNLGVALSAMGRYGEAIPFYHAALALSPDRLNTQLNLGVALTAQGQLDDAVMWLENVAGRSPENAAAQYNLALAYFKQGKAAKAVQACYQALRAKPDYTEAAYLLGLAFEKQQSFDQAADVFDKLLQIDPNHQGARKELQRLRPATP